jgi:molecular chaperone DnaK (HSP70)
LLDVTPATYSVELIGGAVLPLISSNTTIPTLARETFTIRGTGDELVIRIYQGDSHMASNNSLIGHVDFSGLQLGTQIEVTFQIDANNTLSVSARHMTTGKNVDVEIKAPHRLSQEELKRMQPWVDQGLCSYREQHGGRRI